jgi:hypothetical protein
MRTKSENYQLMDADNTKRTYINKVLYISVGRCQDKCTIASYLSDPQFTESKSAQYLFLSSCNNDNFEIGVETSHNHDGFISHFVIDENEYFFYIIVISTYPSRVAFKLISELKSVFISNFKNQMNKAKENELSKNSKKIFSALVTKYQDVEGIDAIIQSLQKVESIKGTLSDTINVMLENQETADSIMMRAEEINQDAAMFKKNTKKLKDRLRCKVYKVI